MSTLSAPPRDGHPRRVVLAMMALAGGLMFCAFLLQDAPDVSAIDWSNLPRGLTLR